MPERPSGGFAQKVPVPFSGSSAGGTSDGAAMLGAVPIIIDPIFSGLAWSLIFGLFASTLFTLFVIPVVYWLLYANKPGHGMPQSAMEEEEAGEQH